ncbi:MAG: Zn-ribbon domain-containing OB-fold protein [Chloroflexi bacterium]|nr:Zn-ribbon domain-containing OB-fold protein [Chloroflexota bacterium]
MERYVVHPEADQDSAPYWQFISEHGAKLQKCTNCGRFRFPPSPSCYYCGTLGGNWVRISGRGSVYTWIVVHHPVDKRLSGEVPFVVAMVDLEEGPRVAGRLIDADRTKIRAGMPVRIRYDDMDSQLTLLNFEPAL